MLRFGRRTRQRIYRVLVWAFLIVFVASLGVGLLIINVRQQ